MDSPRNLFEIHRDRRFREEETTLWVGAERRSPIKRPKFKSNLPKRDVERFWSLSTLILDVGQQHISAAYCDGRVLEEVLTPRLSAYWQNALSLNHFAKFGTITLPTIL